MIHAEAASIVGTSSMYNRESLNESKPDRFQSSTSREIHDGNWTIQGADAGIFKDEDIFGVRLVATPPKPFTKPIKRYGNFTEWQKISRFLSDKRLNDVVAKYSSLHGERWEILGEFPLSYKDSIDKQGNPDSSWLAKIPAETPFFIQAIDKNGMTLTSELTWRALKSGEKRADCGGCHAHSVEPLDFETTEAGKATPINNIAGLDNSDARIQNGLWDLTQGSIPTLTEEGVIFKDGYSYGVEFNRDVLPIINDRCTQCHTQNGSGSKLILDGINEDDAYAILTNNISSSGKRYIRPQRSKYMRVPQARQSLLIWVVFGERLDGRTNETRDDDIDYPDNHPTIAITDIEKRTIARWVDLGGPINFPTTDGFGYTDDNQLPTINIYMPTNSENKVKREVKIGFNDAKSGLDWASLKVSYYSVADHLSTYDTNADSVETSLEIEVSKSLDSKNILTFELPDKILEGIDYIIKVEIKDLAGNRTEVTQRFTVNKIPLPVNPKSENSKAGGSTSASTIFYLLLLLTIRMKYSKRCCKVSSDEYFIKD